MNPVVTSISFPTRAVRFTRVPRMFARALWHRFRPLGFFILLWTVIGFPLITVPAARSISGSPNFVIIFCDDLGYADIGCYGARDIRTPNIDQMAEQGVRFTDFYVAQPVCSASRAALLTGCYPNPLGILGALGRSSKTGIHANE